MAHRLHEEMKDFVPELKKLTSGVLNSEKSAAPLSKTLKCKIIKESRDYSFLKSDGAEIPMPSKGEHEEVGKSKSSSAKSESSSTKQCSTKPMPKQNKSVPKHPIKYRVKEEHPEVVIGKSKPSLAKSESCSIKQGLKHTKQSIVPKCTAKPMPKLKKSIWRIRSKTVKEEQSVDVSSVIQKIFGRKLKRPRENDDGDDRVMVSTFDDILKEERKSAKIANEEDERERLLLKKERNKKKG